KQGRLNDAQAWYQQSIAEGNASAGVYNNLGIIAMQQEDYGRAVEYLRKAHAAAPDNINITYSLASTLRDNREFDEALLLYKQVIADNPGYPNIHNDLGGIYEIMGRPQAAEREFQMECDSIPAIAAGDNRDPDAVVRLARAYNGLGECEQALAMLSALIEVLPRYREAYYARADVQTKLGDIAAAHEDLETVRNLINHPETANVPGASVPAAAIDPEAGQSSGFFNDIEVALKNGRTLRGRLKKETQTTMTLEMRVGDSFGTITFQKHAVKSVKKLQ
ncbi:MAG: tetratricopeptide repeat protein, partial [Candidatus Omnitrophica bacterium]|nr:tetratricopeptide repeat protein [Candidatus Omnitrophota bacterium]